MVAGYKIQIRKGIYTYGAHRFPKHYLSNSIQILIRPRKNIVKLRK